MNDYVQTRTLSRVYEWEASVLPFVLLVATVSCQSSPQPKPEDVEDDDPSAILDAPIPDGHKPKPKASLTEAMMLLPETPQKPSIEIDAKDDDWKGIKSRSFHTKSSVEDGLQYWSGRKDAALKVAVNADEGFLHFYIEVADDEVVETPMGEDPADGVVLWLRDPGLDALGKALPKNVGLHEYVDAETAILLLPSGRVEAFGGRDELDFNEVMLHDVATSKSGYTIELALKLEAFEEISAIPLDEIAFRVELLDGDDPDRPGFQTKISTTPDRDEDAPRFATLPVPGLLPHRSVGEPPPRLNAIGRWKVEGDKWNFVSFEVIPRYWATLEDTAEFEETLRKADTLKDVCGVARKDIHLVEAYQTRGGKFRTGLVLCGQRAVKGKCPQGAKSNVLLIRMQPDGDGWVIDKSINVFKKPSNQCTYDALRGEDFYAHLSLFPLDVLGATVWAVGWTRTFDDRDFAEEAYGITMLNTKYDVPHLGTTLTRFRKMTVEERSIGNSSVYLTYVDDDDQVDLCQVEDFVEQACAGLDRGCRTYEHGATVLTHIQMWSKKKRRFERYELSKHKGCSASFDFSDAEGYLFLQLKDRIGLLPSPRTNDGSNDEKLDLF